MRFLHRLFNGPKADIVPLGDFHKVLQFTQKQTFKLKKQNKKTSALKKFIVMLLVALVLALSSFSIGALSFKSLAWTLSENCV